jgi:hypothetical protein
MMARKVLILAAHRRVRAMQMTAEASAARLLEAYERLLTRAADS